jgi:hypothetical protein
MKLPGPAGPAWGGTLRSRSRAISNRDVALMVVNSEAAAIRRGARPAAASATADLSLLQ